MEDKIKVAGEIAAHTNSLSEKSLCRLAAILEPRKLLKNELFLKEGDVARSMGVVEQGMVRQFYRKKIWRLRSILHTKAIFSYVWKVLFVRSRDNFMLRHSSLL